MPRIYTCTFGNVLVAAPQDLISLKGIGTTKIAKIIRAWVGATDTTIPTAQMLQLNMKFSTATFTAGSVGTAGVAILEDQGDGAVSATLRKNDTTQGTTSGAFTSLMQFGVHIYAGLDFKFPYPIPVGLNEGFIFELLSTVTGTVHMSGGIEFTEEGG
jgi:hypothetical protein